MKKTRQLVTIGLLATGLVALYGCSSDAMQGEEDSGNIQPVELKIRTSVEMARAESNGTEGVVKGTSFIAGDKIAVYANSTHYNTTSNNNAVYTAASDGSSLSWSVVGAGSKIYLSTENTKIYAVYPSTLTVEHSSAVTDNTNATGLNLFEGSDTSTDEDTRIAVPNSAATPPVYTAKGEKDYMYATPVADKTASDNSASLTMKHALAMISFKFYKDDTFKGTGSLTKIVLENIDKNSTTLKTGSASMAIKDGTISNEQDGTNKSLTRYPYTDTTAGYTLTTITDGDKSNLPTFGMLVYPNTSLADNKVKAVFTIDEVEYPINIPAATSSSNEWAAGYNTTYTVKMKGKELGITSVTVTDWQTTTVSDELVPIDPTKNN
ncbi:fimbrillin family protein [Phocaeicola sp.]